MTKPASEDSQPTESEAQRKAIVKHKPAPSWVDDVTVAGDWD